MKSLCAAACLALFAVARASNAEELQWKDEWPTYRLSEGIVTGAAGIGFASFYLVPHADPTWGRPILFDGALRNALRTDNESTHNFWQRASTFAYLGMLGFPFVDALVTPLARGNARVGAQMALIDLEAFAITGLLYRASETFIGRARPSVWACIERTGSVEQCRETGLGATNSFISGHVAIAATGAALTCTHHYYLELYGRPWDAIACGTGILLTAAVGVGRLITDNHYATDVLSGALVGALSGWLVPTALHYAYPKWTGKSGVPVPVATAHSLGVGWALFL